MLHPLEQVRDHQNPLADTPALVPCQAPQLRRPRFAAKKSMLASPIPQTWYAYLITLPHLGIPGSRYKRYARPRSACLRAIADGPDTTRARRSAPSIAADRKSHRLPLTRPYVA